MDNGECRYRGCVIGWLVRGSDGFLKYHSVRKLTAWQIDLNLRMQNAAV